MDYSNNPKKWLAEQVNLELRVNKLFLIDCLWFVTAAGMYLRCN
ncbi:hypothetical protein C5167_006758, partial [Papaver somniferum]